MSYIIYHIITYHIISHHITSHHIWYIISYHIILYHTIPRHTIPYHIISYHISYLIYHITSHHITSHHNHISYHIIYDTCSKFIFQQSTTKVHKIQISSSHIHKNDIRWYLVGGSQGNRSSSSWQPYTWLAAAKTVPTGRDLVVIGVEHWYVSEALESFKEYIF